MLIISTAFDLSDGIETSLTAVLPPGLETVADMEEKDSYSDYDLAEKAPAESDSDTDYDPANLKAPTQTRRKAPTQVLPERSVKAYLVKYTAYRTFVSNSYSKWYSLMDVQLVRDHLVHLFRTCRFLSQ